MIKNKPKRNPPRGKLLPKHLKDKWEEIYDEVYIQSGDKPHAARIAWYQIEKVWKRTPKGEWVLKQSSKLKKNKTLKRTKTKNSKHRRK